MSRSGFVALLVMLIAVGSGLGHTDSEAKGNQTVISGGDLPHAVSIPAEDDLAFRWLHQPSTAWDQFPQDPSVLDRPPEMLGRGYTVFSDLWGEFAYRAGIVVTQERQIVATTYYPEARAAEIRIAPGSVSLWVSLDAGRAALLDRYIALARDGLLPQAPSILDVLSVTPIRTQRPAPIEVDGRAVASSQATAFWLAMASADWPEVPIGMTRQGARVLPAAYTDDDPRLKAEVTEAAIYGYPEYRRLVFTEPDGRHAELAYYPVTRVLAGLPPPSLSAPVGRGIAVPPNMTASFEALITGSPLPSSSATDTTTESPISASVVVLVLTAVAAGGTVISAVTSLRARPV